MRLITIGGLTIVFLAQAWTSPVVQVQPAPSEPELDALVQNLTDYIESSIEKPLVQKASPVSASERWASLTALPKFLKLAREHQRSELRTAVPSPLESDATAQDLPARVPESFSDHVQPERAPDTFYDEDGWDRVINRHRNLGWDRIIDRHHQLRIPQVQAVSDLKDLKANGPEAGSPKTVVKHPGVRVYRGSRADGLKNRWSGVPGLDGDIESRFPAEWGKPPRVQTKDLRTLPQPYGGKGSGTLASWIQKNLDADFAKQKPKQVVSTEKSTTNMETLMEQVLLHEQKANDEKQRVHLESWCQRNCCRNVFGDAHQYLIDCSGCPCERDD